MLGQKAVNVAKSGEWRRHALYFAEITGTSVASGYPYESKGHERSEWLQPLPTPDDPRPFSNDRAGAVCGCRAGGLGSDIRSEHNGVSRGSEQKFWRGKTCRRRASLARGVRVCPPKFVSKAVKLRASGVRCTARPALQPHTAPALPPFNVKKTQPSPCAAIGSMLSNLFPEGLERLQIPDADMALDCFNQTLFAQLLHAPDHRKAVDMKLLRELLLADLLSDPD